MLRQALYGRTRAEGFNMQPLARHQAQLLVLIFRQWVWGDGTKQSWTLAASEQVLGTAQRLNWWGQAQNREPRYKGEVTKMQRNGEIRNGQAWRVGGWDAAWSGDKR